MRATLPNIKTFIKRSPREEAAEPAAAEPKPPPALSLFFMLSHLEDDGPVRLDGVKLAVMEVMGLELDEPKLGAFAGSLNALDFPVQLLVRQHPPVLQTLRNNLTAAQPEDLPQQTRDAADSLGRLLTTLENREGILDRRFYAVCEHGRADELRALLVRAGLGVFPLAGDSLRLLLLASALGGSPNERDEDEEVSVEVNRRDIRIGEHLTRSLPLGKWPRPLAPASPLHGAADVLERGDRAVRSQIDGHEVDALVGGQIRVLHAVGRSQLAQAALLARAQRLDGASGLARPPQLHLDEDERAALQRDQIDLALAAAHVAIDQPVAARLEVVRGEALAGAPQPVGRPRHRGEGLASTSRTGAKSRRCTLECPRRRSASRCSAVA